MHFIDAHLWILWLSAINNTTLLMPTSDTVNAINNTTLLMPTSDYCKCH